MKQRKRTLAGLLAILMLLTTLFPGVTVPALADDASSEAVWNRVAFEDIQATDQIAITMTKGETTWVLPSVKTSSSPEAAEAKVSGDTLTTTGSDDYIWNITSAEGGSEIKSPSGNYLYTINDNKGVRVGSTQMTWTLDGNYLAAEISESTTRWLCVYTANYDWRTYRDKNGTNIAGQSVSFWKLDETSVPDPDPDPEPDPDPVTVTPIEEVRAASEGTFTVQGTVVLVDGRNVYVQDSTGGIDLFFSAAPSGINLGDVIQAAGTRADYKGLEELSGVTEYTKTGTADLPSKTVTVAEILADQETGALESTRVKIEGAVIGAVNTSGNTTLTQGDSTINIYKCPTLETVSEGDTVTLYAVVSDFNGYQLRVASANDVTVTSGGEVQPEEPVLASGDYVIWAPAYGMALSSVYNGFYNTGVPVTEAEGKLTGYGDSEVWTVTANGDDTYTISSGGQNLAMADSYSSLTLGEKNDQWVLEDAGDGLFYVKNTVRGSYIEWYASKSNWSGYGTIASGSEGMFALKFTPAAAGGEEKEPAVASGDYVVWAPAYSMALSSVYNGFYNTGVPVTEAEGKLTGYGDSEVWTVTANEDDTYTISFGGQNLAMADSYSSLTLGEKNDRWVLEDAGNGLFYVKNTVRGSYIEWYAGKSNWSGYGTIASGSEGMFALRFTPVEKSAYTIDTSIVLDIAQWGGSGPYDNTANAVSIPGDLYLSNDMKDTGAAYTVNAANTKPFSSSNTSTGGTNYYMGATGLGSGEGDYAQFAFSSSGFGAMTMSFRLRASNTAAKDYTLQYSVDGKRFEPFTTGSYSYSYTQYGPDGVGTPVSKEGSISDGVASAYVAAQYISFQFDVPSGADNAETLYIRLVPGTENAKGTGAPGTSGALRLDTVKIEGSPIVSDTMTGLVKVTPDAGEVPVGQELTMSSKTEGAVIHYTVDGGKEQTYSDGSKPVLNTLPAVITAWATSEGRTDSIKVTYVYTQAQVSQVKASPNGGAVPEGTRVSLTCETEGAVIQYSLDNGETWNVYDAEEKVILSTLPASVMVKASKEGYLDSAEATLEYTKRENENYNLYFGQLHSHTSYSDGAGTAEDAFKHASQVDNLDFLALTDHSNSFDNADKGDLAVSAADYSSEWAEGKALAKQYSTEDFVGLFGFEMTWSNGLGHINTFNTPGFQSRTQSDYTTYATALQNYYAKLKSVPASISQFNHPGTTFGDFNDFAHYDADIDNQITLIEVGNGEGAIGSSGYFPSYQYYTRALDKGWHVAPTNNQDNHKGLWGDANTARTVVLADSLTEANIYDAMRNYRVYATEDNDLSILYKLDGYEMGTILPSGGAGDTADITVALSDPTDSAIGTVQVIVNGGLVADSKTVSTNEETVSFSIPANYSYYYIKVTQPDGNIAVTAPVWVGSVEAAGISGFTTDAALPVQDQPLELSLDLYNNEKSPLVIDKITFTIGTGEEAQLIHTADLSTLKQVDPLGTANYTFTYTHDKVGKTNIYANVYATLNGAEKVYQEVLQLEYVPDEMVTRVLVDGTHYNDYVTGYYGGNMGNFTKIAADLQVEVHVETEEITAEMLADADLLVISAPAKRSGTANAGDYVPALFEDSFIDLVADYVKNGGSVIVCGLADYQDKSAPDASYHTSAQLNKLLEAIGSTMRINDDEAYDEVNNGGQAYRLYPDTFNTASPWLQGLAEGQVYSQYSGCTVDVGSGTWLVNGFDSTYSIDSDNDGKGGVSKGEATVLACEETAYGGTIFAAGGVFLSDFEVKAEMDNIWDLPYANRTIAENILGGVRKELPVSTIAQLRQGDMGEVFRIQGYVTAGTAVEENKFFDAIYVQDETGGVCVFPYAETGLEIGTKMDIVGYVDAYQGDKEIQVMSASVIPGETKVYQPAKMSSKDAMDYENNGGELIQVEGTVKDVVFGADGKSVSQFVVVDEQGDEAKVFIDGYIRSAATGTNELASIVRSGNTVSAAGILYMHPEGNSEQSVPVLRVRNCDEIVLLKENENKPEPDPDKDSVRGGMMATSATFTKGEDISAVITCSGALKYFSYLTIDGKTVPQSSYELEEGSTIITLSGSYLSTLSAGEHKLRLVYEVDDETYSVETLLTVIDANADGSGTQDQDKDQNQNQNQSQNKNNGSGNQSDKGSTGVKTGDSTNIVLWVIVLAAAAAGLVLLLVTRKKSSRKR